jgi:hypothetical protein
MLDSAVCVYTSRWRSLTAHGHRCPALSVALTGVVGNAGALDARILVIAQGTSVPIRGEVHLCDRFMR